jgi:hypothetical protein
MERMKKCKGEAAMDTSKRDFTIVLMILKCIMEGEAGFNIVKSKKNHSIWSNIGQKIVLVHLNLGRP